jgi:phosphoglucomutase
MSTTGEPTSRVHSGAGKAAPASALIDIKALLAAYFSDQPDPAIKTQRVSFGTSGHRGTSLDRSFNEWHVLAISQAIAEYRAGQGYSGPLYMGIDTHALSVPALHSALEVLAANDVQVLIAPQGEFTPTPAISRAILVHNRGRKSALADGIVITPSHNPPDSGGFKYNPPNGGPADTSVTDWIQNRANALIENTLKDVKRVSLQVAMSAATTHVHDFLGTYVADLDSVLDFDVIRSSAIRMGVDPLGGAGVHYWSRIAETYRLPLTVVSEQVDPTFAFMTLDWDGRIRMDPSSAYAMQRLIGLKDRYDIAFGCDTDHDRHGIVTPSGGLVPPNHYLSVAIDYLFRNRSLWSATAGVGKTVVSSAMIDRVTAQLGRRLFEVPVGFKWFVDGLIEGSLAFGGEESAGATFNRRDGSVWTTDKDGITAALLSAEITARSARDPSQYYQSLASQLGNPVTDRLEARASAEQRARLGKLAATDLHMTQLGGEPVQGIYDRAPGNNAPIGGAKVVAAHGWFAARPSGTEDIYKIYGESFLGADHLQDILKQAQQAVDATISDSN